MSDFARFWRLLVLVHQPLAVISPCGREGDNMLPVIFFFQSKQQIFSPGFLWLSLLLIRGVRRVGEGGGGSWESNYFSLFCPKRFFFFSCRVWRERGGWAAEMRTRTQTQKRMWCPGQSWERNIAFVKCLFWCFHAEMTTTFVYKFRKINSLLPVLYLCQFIHTVQSFFTLHN